jgi:hypothetical protein
MKKYAILAATFLIFQCTLAQNLYVLPGGFKNSSMSSFENLNGVKGAGGKTNRSAKGNAYEDLKSGASKTLLDVAGTGIIQRMWVTVRDRSPEMMRSLRLRMYWDGATKPAVDVPFGDFFGFGLSKVVAFESALFSSPQGRSFNCIIPMPFRKGARVVLTNESAKDVEEVFFDIDYTLVDKLPKDALYFHAYWTRQKTCALGKDFEFVPEIRGQGKFLGVNMGVLADTGYGNTWWGEGEVKFYMDNDGSFPSINGTGTEDYIGTGWGMESYINRYQGCTVADSKHKQYAFYRFHVPDVVGFQQNFRASIQQIGGGPRDMVRTLVKKNVKLQPVTLAMADGFIRLLDNPKDLFDPDFPNGWVNFYRIDDYSATSYFYLDTPTTDLAGLPAVSERVY